MQKYRRLVTLKRTVLTAGGKKTCAYKGQYEYTDASHQITAKHFSLLWDKSISLQCVGDMSSKSFNLPPHKCKY